jgi:hypothetical protein
MSHEMQFSMRMLSLFHLFMIMLELDFSKKSPCFLIISLASIKGE